MPELKVQITEEIVQEVIQISRQAGDAIMEVYQTDFEIPRDWLVVISDVVQDIANNYNQIFGSGIVVPDVKVDTKTLLKG